MLSLSHVTHVCDSVETLDRFLSTMGIGMSLASWSYSCSLSANRAIVTRTAFCAEIRAPGHTRCGEPSSTGCAGTNSWILVRTIISVIWDPFYLRVYVLAIATLLDLDSRCGKNQCQQIALLKVTFSKFLVCGIWPSPGGLDMGP